MLCTDLASSARRNQAATAGSYRTLRPNSCQNPPTTLQKLREFYHMVGPADLQAMCCNPQHPAPYASHLTILAAIPCPGVCGSSLHAGMHTLRSYIILKVLIPLGRAGAIRDGRQEALGLLVYVPRKEGQVLTRQPVL